MRDEFNRRLDAARNRLEWLYLQYELNTTMYTMTFGEKVAFNVITASWLTLALFWMLQYLF